MRTTPQQYFGEPNYGENSYQVNGNYPNYFPWLIFGGICIVAIVAIFTYNIKK